MRTERKRFASKIGVWLAIIMLTASLAACSSSQDSSKSEATAATEAPMSKADSKVVDGFRTSNTTTAETADADTAAAETSQTSSGIADTSTQTDFNRQVIYTADLRMQVKDFANARNTIDKLITNSGGFLLSFTEDQSSNEMSGSFKIKVPANGFNTFIDAIDKMPDKKLSKSINGEDVTEEYADLTARLKAKEVAEARLLAFMESAKTSKDLVAFSNELAQVQEDIERIKGRMRYIDQNVQYSTINIKMYQTLNGDSSEVSLDVQPSLMKKAGNALNKSADMLVELGKAIVIVAAFLVPLLPVIGVIIFIIYIVNRRKKRTKPAPSPTSQQNDQTATSDDLNPPTDDQHT